MQNLFSKIIMSDLIVNLNKTNKIGDNNPEMGNSFGAYTDPNGVHTKSILKPDVYTHPYDLNSIKNRTLSASKTEMESKALRPDDHKRMVNEAALQAASLQAITAWAELCLRIKRAYRIASQEMTDLSLADELGAYAKKLGETLWRDDWQQLLLKLQVLLREMAVEQREKLRRTANTQATARPDEYIKALLQGHKAFCAAGDALAPVLPTQIDKILAKRFAPADFRLLNSRMFESCVYSDPVIQDSVPAAIGRVAGNDRQLVRSYLTLDERMTDVASRWLDVKKLILKLGKGRAQLLDDWKACKELREIASDSNWRIRKKPPSVGSLPDFDVQLMTLTDELSTDRNCACSTDNLPDTPPRSPDQPDLLKLVSKTSKLLSPVRMNQKPNLKPQDKVINLNKQNGNAKPTNKTNNSSGNQMNKENQVPKNAINTNNKVGNVTRAVNPPCDHKQKEAVTKKKPTQTSEDKCAHEKVQCDTNSNNTSNNANKQQQKKSGTCQCECPHGEEGDVRQITKYNKLRERLRTRLKEKQKTGSKNEPSSSSEKSKDDRDIAQLLNFIEGNDNLPDPIKAQKNAARKLRRQERKLEAERQKQEEERLRIEQERLRLEQEALAKAAEAKALAAKAKKEKANAQQDNENGKKPGPMVTIKRVMQGSNKEPTVTITLKGTTPDKDKLLFTLINGQTDNIDPKAKVEPNNKTNQPQINPSQLSKKQRKKLKKEQAKNQANQVPQPITPVPQAKPEKSNPNNRPKTNNNVTIKNSNNSSANSSDKPVKNIEPKEKENSVKVSLNANKSNSVLNLQMLKLPPGITITKVEGPSTERKIQVNAKTTPPENNPSPPVQNTQPVQSNDNRSGIIVVDTVKLKQDLPPGADNSTQKNKKNKKKKNKNKQKDGENKQSDKKNEDEVKIINSTSNSNGMFTLKNPMFYPVQESMQDGKQPGSQQASIIKGANGMVTIRSPRLGGCNGNGGAIPFMSLQAVAGDMKPAHVLGELKPVIQPQQQTSMQNNTQTITTSNNEKPFDAQQILSGLPGIEITKINKGAAKPRNEKAAFQPADVSIIPTSMAANGDVYKLFYDNADWSLESVFAPKDIKEDEILDAEELELEAFKRFCQQSVPPERKEKVAYLNVKDIILKKKASEKC